MRRAKLKHQLDEMLRELEATRSALSRRDLELRNLMARQAMILRLTQELAGSSDADHVARVATRAARTVSGADQVVIWTLDEERTSVRVLADSQTETDDHVEVARQRWAPIDEGLIGDAISERQPVNRVDADGTRRWVWPLVVANQVNGALEVIEGPVQIDDSIYDAVSALAIQTGSALEASRLHHESKLLARRDVLTHLPNRLSFDEDLDLERERSRRHGNPVSLVMIDLDRFKAINDTFGHPFGDEVLRRAGSAIREALRRSDTAYRVGGEEFAVIARDTDVIGAELLAERLRIQIEACLSPDLGDPVVLTASFGVAELGTKDCDTTQMVAAADAALYAAKRNGRNRVEVRFSLLTQPGAFVPVVVETA